MSKTKQVFIALGSNLGDRRKNMLTATALIEAKIGPIIQASKLYETAAWGIENQPDFLNQVIEITTPLLPTDVLAQLLDIEQYIGRIRDQKWGTRSIDLDLVFYENEVVDLPHLKVPHPHLHTRNFVLIPLLEIAPYFTHPIFEKTIEELYMACQDPLDVWLFEN